MPSTPANPDYEELYQSAAITGAMRSAISVVVNAITNRRQTYDEIATKAGVPWWMVATIHQKEAALKFDRHLHNGDPLSGRTVRVPRGRIPGSDPPFTFVQSAIDALQMQRSTFPSAWDVQGCLKFSERYNGFGYRKRNIYSPYVWCGTQHYIKGKYVSDGKFDSEAVSRNPGVAAILLMMEERGLCDLDGSALLDHEPAIRADDDTPDEAETPWMKVALSELEHDVVELPGSRDNPRILEYFSHTRLQASSDETPWCAAFVCFCLEQAGLRSTNSAGARSYTDYGSPSDGAFGDIAVFWRDRPDSSKGHVAFVHHIDGDEIFCLGGNQRNRVCVVSYPRSQLLGFRRPREA